MLQKISNFAPRRFRYNIILIVSSAFYRANFSQDGGCNCNTARKPRVNASRYGCGNCSNFVRFAAGFVIIISKSNRRNVTRHAGTFKLV